MFHHVLLGIQEVGGRICVPLSNYRVGIRIKSPPSERSNTKLASDQGVKSPVKTYLSRLRMIGRV